MPAPTEFAVDLDFSRSPSKSSGEIFCFSPKPVEPHPPNTRVLLVGLDPELRADFHRRLAGFRWHTQDCSGGAHAVFLLEEHSFEVVVLAPSLPDLDSSEIRTFILERFPGTKVLSPELFRVEYFGAEAEDTEAPPQAHAQSLSPRVASVSGLASVNGSDPGKPATWHGMVGNAPSMSELYRLATLVARRDTTVLVRGENGTGKDLLARAIHDESARAKQPFVVINCAAIPEALLEAELFGFTKGSFTGALQSRVGRVHAAHGGTLFLDEIGDLPLPLQSKILRFLEQGEVQQLGATHVSKVDCRIVAATNVNLEQQIRSRQFREDLYYRLAVLPLTVAPLRERISDLPALCESFLERFCPGATLGPGVLERLSAHHWPGNVRELRNVMERASIFAEGRRQIAREDICFG